MEEPLLKIHRQYNDKELIYLYRQRIKKLNKQIRGLYEALDDLTLRVKRLKDYAERKEEDKIIIIRQ